MAAGITKTDHMAYVGARPWHGYGTELPSLATAAEMINAAKLGFLVEKKPLYIVAGYGDSIPPVIQQLMAKLQGADQESALVREIQDMIGSTNWPAQPKLQTIKSHVATARSDNGDQLGVVTNDYTVVQNLEAFRFLDHLTEDPNGPKYETAGSLHGGRTVWALAKVQGIIEVAGVDPVANYLFVKTSHDGSGAFTVAWTPIRIVCQNTLNMALGSMKLSFRFVHTGKLEDFITNAKQDLGIITKATDLTLQYYNEMQMKQLTESQADGVLERYLMVPPNPDVPLTDKQKEKRTDIKRDVLARFGGKGIGLDDPALRGTGWGLNNAFVEWADRNTTVRRNGGISDGEARFRSNFIGNAMLEKAKFSAHLEKELALTPLPKLVGAGK